MGIFGWLFRKRSAAYIVGDGLFEFNIVGESRYQPALDRMCGGRTEDGHEHECQALLVEEPNNPHDGNAVKVTIQGETVGYLSRDAAPRYKKAARAAGLSGQPVLVDALIVGGWTRGRRGDGHYGVKLDMAFPIEFG